MTSDSSNWTTYQLTEFLARVSAFQDVGSALRGAAERAAEAVEAEVGAIVIDGAVAASVGFGPTGAPEDQLLAVAAEARNTVEIPGAGPCATAVVPLGEEPSGCLILARAIGDGFDQEELHLLHGLARTLTLALHHLHLLEQERALREDREARIAANDRLLTALAERESLLEKLARIQRSISLEVDIDEVFDAITAGAAELFGDEVAGLRLLEPDDASQMVLVSCSGIDAEALEGSRRTRVGAGAGGRAITEGRLTVIESYQVARDAIPAFVDSQVQAAMAAPVHERGRTVGSLAVASYRPGRTYSQGEREMLEFFAEHASLALSNHRRLARSAEERFRSLVENSSDAIAVVRPDGSVTNLTGAVKQILGRDRSELIGTDLFQLVHPNDTLLVKAFLAEAKGSNNAGPAEWRIHTPDGSHRQVEAAATNLLDDPHVRGLVLTIRDVTERKAFEEQLKHRAFHDPLTQLPNRALFHDRVEQAVARQARNDHLVAVMLVDVDDLTIINQNFGHEMGDQVLVDVAQRLRGSLRAVDTAARLGGDEYGLLLEGVGGASEPAQIAERILAAFRDPLPLRELVLTRVSIGIALSTAGEAGADGLLRKADLAMHAAKSNGKDRYELFEPALEEALLKTSLPGEGGTRHEVPERFTSFLGSEEQRREILSLLEGPHEINPVFQPVLDLQTGRIAGYEALSRFPARPDRPPNVWFAQAHRCGLGPRLEAAAARAALSKPGRPAHAFLCINVSPSALASDEVQAALGEDLHGLVIEITENELVSTTSAVHAAIADARARGALLAIDDAGAGYAGLKQLMRLNPEIIKLDRSLVDGTHTNPAQAALIEALVGYGRRMNAVLCAEGIEELEDLKLLAELGVTYGQGYVIAKPAEPWVHASPTAAEACSRRLAGIDVPAGERGRRASSRSQGTESQRCA